MSNIFGSFFSSYAGSGSFTRSGINYESGAKTPLSAIFAAINPNSAIAKASDASIEIVENEKSGIDKGGKYAGISPTRAIFVETPNLGK
jgi:hypothetical protein